MNPSYNQIKIQIAPVSYDNWLKILKQPESARPQFKVEQGTIMIGQVIARFLGVPADEDEYYNRLYDYVHSEGTGMKLLSRDTLNKAIDNQQFQSIQKVLNLHQQHHLSINRFTAFLDGEQLLLKSKNPALNRKIREAMIAMLDHYAQSEEKGLMNSNFRRVLVDVIKWSFNHLEGELEIADPDMTMPKFLWYGPYNKSHQYFLYYLMKLGCDLIVFHPDGCDIFEVFDPNQTLSFVHKYPQQREPEAFPVEKSRRTATIAYRASREIESILNHEGSGLYKPWQLRDYSPSSVTLKTTYDELFLIVKEKAMIRPNFEVKNGMVKVPCIFAKIQGVSRNRKEYWDRLQELTQLQNCMLIKQFPIMKNVNNDFRFHYRNALGRDGLLVPEKMMEAHYWKYGLLPGGLQRGIAGAIRTICGKNFLKPLHNETPEEVQIFLFTMGMQIPSELLKLLQQFDYSQDVPKLILYNNEMNGTISRADAALFLLLNQFGVDLVLYNPPGHNDVENFIMEDLFDIHWLEDFVFEQEFKEPSLLKKVLFQGILKNRRGD